MIIEFASNKMLLSYPPQWTLYYKQPDELYFNEMTVSFEQLKLFLEKYGYETNNLLKLQKFGINTKNISYNKNLQPFSNGS
jgi:hypothetical protein